MPVILGPDGPSLGGFVCPATIARAELWKIGQLKAGDTVRFVRFLGRRTPGGCALEVLRTLDAIGAGKTVPAPPFVRPAPGSRPAASPVLAESHGRDPDETVVYRRDGDDNVLVEYGPPVLELGLRLRAHALMQALERLAPRGIIDLTPGIRSLQVHYDPVVLPTPRLLELLRGIERDLPRLDEIEIASRIVHMPLSWEDQFVGRTLQVWNTHRATADFGDGKPYLLRFFDEIRFYPVEAGELLALREAFPYGKAHVPIEPSSFRYSTYRAWLGENTASIAAFKKTQQAAFVAERERWRAAGQDLVATAPLAATLDAERPAVPDGCFELASPVAGSVWKLAAGVGAHVRAGNPVIVVEAMKTEIAVSANASGTSTRCWSRLAQWSRRGKSSPSFRTRPPDGYAARGRRPPNPARRYGSSTRGQPGVTGACVGG